MPTRKHISREEKELEGKISYLYIKELIDSESRELNIRRAPDNKFILRYGNDKCVERGDGINYLHFHPDGCSGKEFEGLPSLNDICIMFRENEPHIIISKKGISVYAIKKKLPPGYAKISRMLKFPDVDNMRIYESRNYNIFRSKVKSEPIRVRMDHVLIEYLPWDIATIQEHDFREVPKLKFNSPQINIPKFLILGKWYGYDNIEIGKIRV